MPSNGALHFTTRGEYGVRLMVQLGRRYGNGPASLTEIAADEDLPRAYLEQLLGRIADPLEIPGNVFAAEARDICRAFAGAAPGEELVKLAQRIANEPGKLGVLYELLRQASVVARKRKEPPIDPRK